MEQNDLQNLKAMLERAHIAYDLSVDDTGIHLTVEDHSDEPWSGVAFSFDMNDQLVSLRLLLPLS